MAISGHKGVSRIDQVSKNHHGWYVRVRYNGTTVSKFFRDGLYGNRDKALKAAVSFRNDTEKELGKPRTDRTILPMTTRNTSGVVGVRRRVRARKPVNGEQSFAAYYEACWSPRPGKLQRKLFSVDQLGERGAFLAACAFRREREREMLGGEIRANWAAAAAKILSV